MKKMIFEKKMRYCLTCQDEYMPEIEQCGVCGAKLLTGEEVVASQNSRAQQMNARKGALTDKDDVVTILKASISEVRRIEQLLVNENIGTSVIGDGPACGKGCCGGGDVELLVRREDAQSAMQIIEQDFDKVTAINSHNTAYADYAFDSSSSANICPACGTSFSGSATCPDCGLCFA
nr:hypothetical protein [Desulfobulbaceae bacterium]